MKKIRKGLLIGFVVGMSGFILYQGTRNLDTSLAFSDQVVNRLLAWVLKDSTLTSDTYYEYYPSVTYLVRKAAHFTEYAMFGCLFAVYFQKRKENKMDVLVYAWLPVLMVAILDEWLQKYVGRGSLVSDVVIDAMGGIVGISAVLLWITCQRFIQNKRKSQFKAKAHQLI